MSARRAKRENGGLGEDPPGSPMTHQQVLRTCPNTPLSEASPLGGFPQERLVHL